MKPRQDSFGLNMSYREKNGKIPLGMYIVISLDMIKYDPVYWLILESCKLSMFTTERLTHRKNHH
jgi:hypothetical protein